MLEEIKVKDLVDLIRVLNPNNVSIVENNFWVIGKSYFIRTVTMYVLGNLKDLNSKELLLKDAVWVADTGRFHDALKTGELNEIEPFVSDVILNRDSIVDSSEWLHKIPREQK